MRQNHGRFRMCYEQGLAENPNLAETLDGDYYQSQWDTSGVVEADCLICHLAGYDFEARVDQLKNGNYRWAVVGGPKRKYLWILSRTPQMDEALYEEIISRLPAKGYDPKRLNRTTQPQAGDTK